MGEQDFSWALRCLKDGSKVFRNGWNGKEEYLFLIKLIDYWKGDHNKSTFETLPFIAMKTTDNNLTL